MSKKTSLAFYLPNLTGGGVERMRIILASAFVERGLEVTIIVDKAEGDLLHSVPKDVKVVSLNASRSLAALPGLILHLRRYRPDILLSSLGHNNIIAIWASKLAMVNTAVIICQHNALRSESMALANWQHRMLPVLYRLFAGWAKGIIAVSNGVAEDMVRTARLHRSAISVIYNPVVFRDFGAKASEPVSHRWLDDRSTQVFIGVGRFVPQKDFQTLIRAFAQVYSKRDCRLLLLGDGPLRTELEDLGQSLGVGDQIDLLGFRTNPLPYVRAADVMVMSSRYEGFGNVIVEGLGCGTEVISTDCPYGPSEILKNGKFGTLVPVGNVNMLAAAMENALTANRRIRSEVLLSRAMEFGVDHIVDKYILLFSKVSKSAFLQFHKNKLCPK